MTRFFKLCIAAILAITPAMLLLATVTPLEAGTIHATVRTDGSGPGPIGWFAVIEEDEVWASVFRNATSDEWGTSIVGGSHSGINPLTGRPELGVFSSAAKDGTFSGSADVLSVATWTDVIAIRGSGAQPLPDFLDLTYFVTGSVVAGGGSASAIFGLTAIDSRLNRTSAGDGMSAGNQFVDGEIINVVERSGWGMDGLGGPRELTFRLPVDPILIEGEFSLDKGVSRYTIEASALVNVVGGGAVVKYDHTAVFGRVTLPDGRTPEEAGYTLTFDSGIQSPNLLLSSPVPEPSSLTLLGLGTAGLCGYGWRRKRRIAA